MYVKYNTHDEEDKYNSFMYEKKKKKKEKEK